MAGLVDGDRLSMTNGNWVLSRTALARHLGVATLLILNDVEALALALPSLGPDDLVTIHPGEARPDGIASSSRSERVSVRPAWCAASGALAVAPDRGRAHDLCPAGCRGVRAGRLARDQRWAGVERGCAVRARVCSPSILPCRAAAARPLVQETAEAITAAAVSGNDSLAVETIALHARWLGRVAGDLALALNARGGVYLAGGVTRHLLRLLIELAPLPGAGSSRRPGYRKWSSPSRCAPCRGVNRR